ncbi:unnamed protein product [Amoebophrya sp. A25]|nr:unnamed protein product [Amoebophrya sp. A25]|eukprot:GSA25T00011710001.1
MNIYNSFPPSPRSSAYCFPLARRDRNLLLLSLT